MSKYIHEKIKIMKQLCIPMNKEQVAHLSTLKNEVQIDNYIRSLQRSHYNL